MRDLVVDGTDGAGKTPLVEALCAALLTRGHSVATCAPYRVQEVFPLWETSPARAAAIITEIMSDFRSAHAGSVVVWDRGWPTAWVSTEDAAARALFLPLPEVTVLLLNTTRVTRMRAEKHGSRAPWMVEEPLIERFSRAYRALAEAALPSKVLTFDPDGEDRFDLDAIVRESLSRGGL